MKERGINYMETVMCKTYTAGVDLTGHQYRFVYLSAENTVTFTGAGEAPIGILQNAPDSGEDANVMIMGMSLLTMSAAVLVMAKVGSAAAGKGVTMAADTDIYGAICIQPAGLDGDQVRVLLCPGAPTISA
jgi:hypothetical protein